jgi:hypothetical protein
MAKQPKRKIHHGLADDKRPIVLTKPSGERIVAQTELAQLQEKREKLAAQLEELDGQILELKKKRHEELMAELHALGLDIPKTAARTKSGPSGNGKRRGRPEGFKMTDEQKQKMKEGRDRARAAKEDKTADPELPMQ